MRLGLRLIAGFLVWSSAFAVLYSVFSLACWLGWDGVTTLIALVALWLGHVLANAVILWRDLRAAPAVTSPIDGRLMTAVLRGSSLAALVATIWTGLPIILTPPIC